MSTLLCQLKIYHCLLWHFLSCIFSRNVTMLKLKQRLPCKHEDLLPTKAVLLKLGKRISQENMKYTIFLSVQGVYDILYCTWWCFNDLMSSYMLSSALLFCCCSWSLIIFPHCARETVNKWLVSRVNLGLLAWGIIIELVHS